MKLSALALDYDGTIATHGVMHSDVRSAIGAARDAGIVVILATGRRLDDLKRVAGDLGCFDVVVAENGAVLDFPRSRPSRPARKASGAGVRGRIESARFGVRGR